MGAETTAKKTTAQFGGHGNDHGDDMDAWPEDLRIREFPRAAEMTGAA